MTYALWILTGKFEGAELRSRQYSSFSEEENPEFQYQKILVFFEEVNPESRNREYSSFLEELNSESACYLKKIIPKVWEKLFWG